MNHRRQSGFTLIELVVSIAIMSIIMTAVGSLMVFSARALPSPDDPSTMMISAGTALNRFAEDVRDATVLTSADVWSVEVQVPDRNGDASADTVRYEWSGTPGDPLVRTYNGDRHEILLEGVRSLQFVYETQVSDFPPDILFVVPDPASMSTEDDLRAALFESWGFNVTTIGASATQGEYDDAISLVSVVYVSEDVLSANVGSKLTEAPRGVVTEEGQLYDDLGISTSNFVINDGEIDITDNSHPITSGLPLGLVRIVPDDGGLLITGGVMTAGLEILAEEPSTINPVLAVMEAGTSRAGIGGVQAGRRVKLPWGNTSDFLLDDLTADGLTIMRQSVEWASEHDVVTGIRLSIAGVEGSTSTAQRLVHLVNMPMEPAP